MKARGEELSDEQTVPALRPGEEGSIQLGPTDNGMVRLIISTRDGVYELDFPPDEAREIAEELLTASAIAERAPR